MTAASVEELAGLLRIPSVAGDRAAIEQAVDYVCDLILASGGVIEAREHQGAPLGVGSLPASVDPASAPSLLVYGHVDVQPVEPLSAWSRDPFDPQIHDGWLYARGAADDKGPFYALVSSATQLAAEGQLPVNVRVLCDTEEESGGSTAVRYVLADEARYDACLIFDASMLVPYQPLLVLATRGIASMRVTVRRAGPDLHSGLFGGVAANAGNALVAMLDAITSAGGDFQRSLRDELPAPPEEELREWRAMDVDQMLTSVGLPVEGETLVALRRLWAEPAVDIHGISVGTIETERNAVPALGAAILSVRVAPGQDVNAVGDRAETLLHDATPDGVEIKVVRGSRTPPAGPFDPHSAPIAIARDTLARVFGSPPVLARTGGSLPILAALSQRGIPTILSGLALPDSHIHGPDERLRVDHLELGMSAARELLLGLGALANAEHGVDLD